MSKVVQGLLAIVTGIGAISTAASASAQTTPESVFVLTNAADKNEVIAYDRNPDGSFYQSHRYATGGRGSGGITDPLQSQGALTLSQDHTLLFAVNAGSGTLSEFSVSRSSSSLTPTLTLINQVATGGSEPVAVTQRANTVYVLNSAGNGSVVGFNIGVDAHLSLLPGGPNYLSGVNTGGASVSISPNGKFMAVIERVPNNIDTFTINSNGTLSPVIVKESAVAGAFSAVFAHDGALLVSATGAVGTAPDSTLSSYAVLPNGAIHAIRLGIPTFGDANCWTVVTPNGKWAYVSNSASSNISGFAIGAGGVITPIANTIVATNAAGSINLNLAISGDGKYLYTQNSGTGTIGVFIINNDGTLTSQGEITGMPPNAGYEGLAAL